MKPYYQDEQVTLFHGDCLEVTEWLEADVLITDPPYGVDWQPRFGGYAGAGSQVNAPRIKGDTDTGLRNAALAMWGGKPALVFGSWKAQRPEGVRALLVWHKQGMAPGPARSAFQTNHEDVYVLGDGWPKTSPPLRSVITTSEARSIEVSRVGHPTPKPVGLMQLLIDRTPPGTIADPFAGSGSTLVAAARLGRQAIGVELEERYCEIAARRLSQGVLDFGEGA